MEDKAVELCKDGLEAESNIAKKQDHDRGVIDKSLQLDLIKILAVISIGPQGFLELKHSVINSYLFFVMVNFKAEALHIAGAVNLDQREFVVEDLYNLFLGEPNKLEGEICNFARNSP